jgi:UDP-glucose 4-epimerase
MGVNWLITGGCGFIGLNLIKNLTEEGGHYIRIVDNLSVGSREDLSEICSFKELDPKTLIPSPSPNNAIHPQSSISDTQTFIESSPLIFHNTSGPSLMKSKPLHPSIIHLIVADILNEKMALSVAKDIDVIVHLAANTGVGPSVKNPRSDCLNNVLGTLNYLEAARYNCVKRFIFASSGAPVGECEPPLHEEIVPHPISPYGASKLSGEAYCSVFFRTYGIETVVLRFGNVYGPLSGKKNSVVAKFFRNTIKSRPLKIYGDGNQTRDFIYIEDLIKAIRLSTTTRNLGGEIFQIATRKETVIKELVYEIISIMADYGFGNIEVRHVDSRAGDVRRNFSDTSKAQKYLGWKAQISLKEGLKMTAKWFLEQ